MSFIDRFLSLLLPYDCIDCGLEGDILCKACEERLPSLPPECYRCRRPMVGSNLCAACQGLTCLYRAQAVTVYDGMSKALVWQLKSAGAKSAAKIMATQMNRLIPDGFDLIIPCPTTAKHIRLRGYDQAELVARHLSHISGIRSTNGLIRLGHANQLGSGRQKRLLQLRGAYRVKDPHSLVGKRVLLVDDVMTTGATFEAAAQALMASGVARVEALAFCRPSPQA